jgi:hypothetical protein
MIARHQRRRRILTATAGALLAMAGGAQAAGAASVRVAVLPFDGPNAEKVQAIVEGSLPPDCTMVPATQVERLMEELGGLREPAAGSPGSYGAVGRRLRAGLVVEGEIVRDDRWQARLAIRRGGTGEVVGRINWSGGRVPELLANAQRGARFWLTTMVDRSGAASAVRPTAPSLPPRAPRPPAPPPEVEDRPAPSDDGADPFEQHARRPPVRRAATLWEISVGPRALSRTFTFTDNISGLPGYTLPAAPAVAAEAELYPGARSASPVGNFGFGGYWETSLGARTVGREGVPSQATKLGAYRGGVRYRVAGADSAVAVGGDYGEHRFELEIPGAIVPNVRYTFLRPFLSGRFTVGGGFTVNLSIAYLHVLSIGALADANRFPRATARGAEGAAAVGLALGSGWEIRLGADLRHYALDMHARPGDPLIAGGALDEHFGASLQICYRLR